MRPLLATCIAATFFASLVTGTVAQAEPCARAQEKAAFNVVGLKSELMVTAITCQAQDKYNSFVARFRRELVSQDRALNAYFARTSRHASKDRDDYITSLANSESQDGIKQGTLFCDQHIGLFDEVLALKDGKDLTGYAATKEVAQPIALEECPLPPARKLKTAAATK